MRGSRNELTLPLELLCCVATTNLNGARFPSAIAVLLRTGWSVPSFAQFTDGQIVLFYAVILTVFSNYKRKPFWFFLGFTFARLLTEALPKIHLLLNR